jgi:NADH:ubiquinone oxidoreductase subunit F (NADH-binding)
MMFSLEMQFPATYGVYKLPGIVLYVEVWKSPMQIMKKNWKKFILFFTATDSVFTKLIKDELENNEKILMCFCKIIKECLFCTNAPQKNCKFPFKK